MLTPPDRTPSLPGTTSLHGNENPLSVFTPLTPTRDENTRRVARLVDMLDRHIRTGEAPEGGGEPPPRSAKDAVEDLNAVVEALVPRLDELRDLGLQVQDTDARWSAPMISRLRAQHIQVSREARAEGTARACLRLVALALEVKRRGRGLPAGNWAAEPLRPLVEDAAVLLREIDEVRAIGDTGSLPPQATDAERAALLARTVSSLGLGADGGEARALAAACLQHAIEDTGPISTASLAATGPATTDSWVIADALQLLNSAEAFVLATDTELPLQKRRPIAQRIRSTVDVLSNQFLAS